MKTSRPYVMRQRAEDVANTRARIIEATMALGSEVPLSALTLPDIAERAGVSVRTALRQFESRDRLLEAAISQSRALFSAERPADPDDVAGSLEALVAHYERRGDGVMLALAQETWEPLVRAVAETGRTAHRGWVARLFARSLAQASDPEALTDRLVVATDVYTWKLLRRDRGHSQSVTTSRIQELVEAILQHDATSPRSSAP